jgi:hypothetical protein
MEPLSVEQVLAWADAHRQRAGHWPHAGSGPVADAPGETWAGIDRALCSGRRGLPGGEPLAGLLDRCRLGVRAAPAGRRTWTPWENELVRALPPEEAARRTGRNLLAVHVRRHELGLPDQFPG